jgi:glycosyltransferase involved in cell wall biosynthesis
MLLTEDWFFVSHFLERAVAARDAGYDVTVLANDNGHSAAIRDAGLGFEPVAFVRRRVNPLAELATVRRIAALYRQIKPDLVHHVALKPILYGTIAAQQAGIRRIINAPVGMGFVFTSQSVKSKVLRPLVTAALRRLLNPPGSSVVFENPDDRDEFVRKGAARLPDSVLIRGAGVNLAEFSPAAEPPPPVTVALVARMLWDKGIGEFVEAARALQPTGARFRLIGATDSHNPAAIPETQLRAWAEECVVEWLGHRTDVPALLREAHIACLPSYREGLPKSLLEAAASGLPIVAADVPGCREAVRDGENGFLVPARDAVALAGALKQLIDDPELRRQFGAAGRRRAETEFASEIVIRETLALYARMLG